jgi:hypothetical protein
LDEGTPPAGVVGCPGCVARPLLSRSVGPP